MLIPQKPVFETSRLRVFQLVVVPMEENVPRPIFVATRKDEDRPMVTATAVVWPGSPSPGLAYIDWVEVTSEYRRMGFATELLQGIEQHTQLVLVVEGGSSDGDGFCAAWGTNPQRTAMEVTRYVLQKAACPWRLTEKQFEHVEYQRRLIKNRVLMTARPLPTLNDRLVTSGSLTIRSHPLVVEACEMHPDELQVIVSVPLDVQRPLTLTVDRGYETLRERHRTW